MKRFLMLVAGLLGLGFVQGAMAVEQGDCDGSGGAAPVNIQDVICTINIVLGTAVPPLPAEPVPPNPTGILFGGDYPSGNNADCSGVEITAQDCARAPGGQAGFDFTKLGADGAPLLVQGLVWSAVGSEAAGTKWSCVKDNHTGLIWEVKTTSAGIHHQNNTYKWGGPTAIGRDAVTQFGSYHDDVNSAPDGWDDLVAGSNSTNFCGYNTGWRVPTVEELASITNNNVTNPAIDTHYFPNTAAFSYWSASPYAGDASFAWRVDFTFGNDFLNFRANSGRVRLVRTGP